MTDVSERRRAKRPTMFPLQRLLRRRGQSVRGMARQLGTSPEVVRGYCRGTIDPSWRTMCQLAELLALDMGDLTPAVRPKGGRHDDA